MYALVSIQGQQMSVNNRTENYFKIEDRRRIKIDSLKWEFQIERGSLFLFSTIFSKLHLPLFMVYFSLKQELIQKSNIVVFILSR